MNNLNDIPLRDIHLPDPISWWPIAPGWWLLTAFILIVAFSLYFFIKRMLRTTLKKEASKALNQIESSFQTTKNASQCISEISLFLRRAMISQNSEVASLTGEAWLSLLDQRLAEPQFREGCGRILLHGPYQETVNENDVVQLIELCRTWVKSL